MSRRDDWREDPLGDPDPERWGEPGPAWAEPAGCGKYLVGLVLAVAAVLLVLSIGWVRSDAAVQRCVDHPAAAGCLPPRP